MSAYPSLLSPLMDATGLIATASLNTLAQTALAAGTYASAEVDVLKDTALQASAGSYTGLPATNITAQGKFLSQPVAQGLAFQSPGFNVNAVGSLGCIQLTTQTSPGVFGAVSGGIIMGNTRVIAPEFKNADSSFITDALGNCTVNELTYTTLNPAIPTPQVPTLSQVLTAGNDAETQNIIGVGELHLALGSLTDTNLQLKTQDMTCNFYLNPLTGNLIISPESDVDLDGSNLVNVGLFDCVSVNLVKPEFKPTYDYYVSKGGSDTGLGSVLSPFLTVQHAVNVCETAYDGTPRVVHLSSGTFTETITISKPRISIIGEGSSMNPDVGSSIAGTISINLTAGNADLNNNNIYFSGLLINGTIEDSVSSIVHRLFFTDCYLYASARCLYVHPVGDYRVFVDRCSISNSSAAADTPLVECGGSGMVSFSNSKLTSKGGVQLTMYLLDTVRVDVFANTILTSDSSSTNAMPILTLNTTQTVSVANCAFIYSNGAVKSNTVNNSSGVFMANSGSLYIIQCFFSLMGLYAPNKCIRNIGTGICYFANNISPSPALAYTIDGVLGTNKVAMIGIN